MTIVFIPCSTPNRRGGDMGVWPCASAHCWAGFWSSSGNNRCQGGVDSFWNRLAANEFRTGAFRVAHTSHGIARTELRRPVGGNKNTNIFQPNEIHRVARTPRQKNMFCPQDLNFTKSRKSPKSDFSIMGAFWARCGHEFIALQQFLFPGKLPKKRRQINVQSSRNKTVLRTKLIRSDEFQFQIDFIAQSYLKFMLS